MRTLTPFIISALLSVLTPLTLAADPEIYTDTKNGAVNGADVVAYWSLKPGDDAVLGSDQFTHHWRGALWKFASAANYQAFKANPETYAPEFGGYCAYAVSRGFTKPVDPDRWDIVDGKLYLNFNRIAQFRWRHNRDEAIAQGQMNWPQVLKACEQHNRCLSGGGE